MAQFIISAFADEAQGDLKGQIAALKRNNIEYIEIRGIDGKCIIDYTDEEIAAMGKELKEAGIKVSSIGSPIGKYNITDDFEPHFERFKRAVKAAQLLEAKYIRMFSFFVKREELAQYKAEVLKRMRVMLDYASAEGIQLCHENEANIYGCLPEQCIELQEELPDLKAIFDPCNYIMEDADIPWAIEHIKQYVEYCHIKDGTLGEHAIVPAGHGDGNIALVLSTVAEARGNKDTFLTIEPHLFQFIGYNNLDKRSLKHKFSFENSNESFDAAVSALKDILKNLGYVEGENKKWIK